MTFLIALYHLKKKKQKQENNRTLIDNFTLKDSIVLLNFSIR